MILGWINSGKMKNNKTSPPRLPNNKKPLELLKPTRNEEVKRIIADYAAKQDDYTAVVCFAKKKDGSWTNYRSGGLPTFEIVGILENMKHEILANVDHVSEEEV